MLLSRRFRYLASLALIVSILSTLTPATVLAHDGHDHDESEVLGPGGAPPAGSGPIDIAGFVRAIDGDTMETWIGGSQVGIGVLGIDALEANTVCGAQGAEFFQNMLFTGIHAEEDADIVFGDRLRRMYYVYTPDGISIAHAMVQAGYAKPTGEGRYAAELSALAAEAEQAGEGCVWNDDGEEILPLGAVESASIETRDLLALPIGFQSKVYVNGLNFPTDFAFLPDGRVLVAEKDGIVRIAVDGSVLSAPFIDIRQQVNDYWDRGLLSIAVDPNFDSNGYVYLLFTYEHDESNYSGPKTGRLIRVAATGNTASPSSAVVILGTQSADSCDILPVGTDCIPSEGPSHSTGGMRFASDGSLYLTLGEAANFNASTPQSMRAQNLDSLGGKLVRINTTGQGLSDNPFWTGNPDDIRSKIWAYGFRNAYRFSLRPGDDTPYVGDVGWVSWEEVNVAEAGANLGWPCYEGNFQQGAYSSEPVCQQLYNDGTVTPPLITWDHTTGGSAVTGGVFYTGTSYPAEYQGAYFYGDYARNFIRYAQISAGNTVVSGPTSFDDTAGGPVAFEIGPDGDIYYLSITSGQILHVVYGGGPGSSESGYVSDLEWASSSNGWGPAERDQSNGEDSADDGGPLTINGTTFTKGVGVHSPSEVVINLDGTCNQFTSIVGIDDEVGSNGTVVFDVYSGDSLLATSGDVTGDDDPASLSADLTEVTQLRLVVSDAGDNVYWDHADWADAWIECGQDTAPPTVVSTNPTDGATDIPLKAAISATFSEAIDEATLDGNVTLLEGTTPVPATVSYAASSAIVTLTPTEPMALSTVFNVEISGGVDGVTDIAGNPLASDATWSFTTADSAGPVPTITSPSSTDTFIVGDEITYGGTAVDANGEPLPSSALRWRVLIHHCNHIDCHTHQVIDETGTSGGTFTVPDHGDQYYFEVQMTATDAGLSNTEMVEIYPVTVDVTLQTIPAGLDVNLAGEQAVGPLTRPIVVGSVVTVSTPSPQGDNVFDSWSDGGARVHTAQVGSDDITLTANFSGAIPNGTIYLSDMTPVSALNHWGPVEMDQSNGEQSAGDGGPLTIGGVIFDKGLGVHAPSSIIYDLDTCTLLEASLGIDDEVGSNGSVVFEVIGNGTSLYTSPTLTGADAALDIEVDVTGVSTLELRTTDGGDNVYWDHADWGDARLQCGTAPGDTTPPTVTSTVPANGAADVAVGTTVVATFSEPVNESTLVGNVTLAQQGGGAVTASLSYSSANNRVTLTPTSPLSADTTYVATITSSVTDAAGNPLASAVNWTFTTAPEATGGAEIYISDMVWISQSNGYGPVERDQSNGEDSPNDGNAITIGGTSYAKGIGAHADSEIVIELDGTCTSFSAIVGLDDEVGDNGSVGFEVWGDGTMRASLNGLNGQMNGQPITTSISGVTTLRLVITDGGDNYYWDHADWADAKIICDGETPSDTTAPEVTATSPVDGATNVPAGITITADFSEDINTESLPGNVELRELGAPGLTLISTTYSAATDRLTISPSNPLDPDATYTVTISGGADGVADLAGNTLASDVEISFTTAAAASEDATYISDMTWISSTNGWGPVERDLANGEQGAGDGAPLSIGGVSFARGLGAHAQSEVVVSLDGACSTFAAMAGVDGEVGNHGSVAFQVYGDGSLLYTSPVQRGGDAPHAIAVDIDGVTELRLVATNGGDNIEYDHADWGDARVICADSGEGDTVPPDIVDRVPAPDAAGVDLDAVVSATFSEALDPASATTVTIEDESGGVIPASLNYSSATFTITLTPAAPLDGDTTYTVTVYGGPTGIRDLAGNPLPSNVNWSFTTTAAILEPSLFADPEKFATGTNTHGVSVADVDSDNNLDLVVATTGDNAVVIMLGDGNGGFSLNGSYPTGVHPKFATTGDFNGDGNIDFASANQDDTAGNDVSVYLGAGDGSFALAGHVEACSNPHEVASGDLDEDGDADLVVVCWGGSVANVLIGNGDGTFQDATDLAVGTAPHSVVLADFDGDNNLDIATTDHDSNTVSVLLGNGNGTFDARLIQSVGSGPHSMRGGDINRDGDPDLVTANDTGDSVSLLIGNGDGTFSRGDFEVGDEPKGVALGDIDGDGWLDVISANIHGTYPCCSGETSITVLFNNHNGGFENREDSPIISSPFSVATGDFNEDGRLDVASANWHTNDVAIFLGNR